MLLHYLNRFFDSMSANDPTQYKHAGRLCAEWIDADINYLDTSYVNISKYHMHHHV